MSMCLVGRHVMIAFHTAHMIRFSCSSCHRRLCRETMRQTTEELDRQQDMRRQYVQREAAAHT